MLFFKFNFNFQQFVQIRFLELHNNAQLTEIHLFWILWLGSQDIYELGDKRMLAMAEEAITYFV